MPTTTGKKIAIVTGSALGLGYELASQLIANGWLVAGVDFNAERQAELTAQWPDDSYRAYVGDITDEAFVKESVADIATLGHIDLLINNAGQPSFKVPTAYEAADVDKCLQGLKGMILWTVETLKACGEQNVKIAQIMSTAATRGNANESVYCATKAALDHHARAVQEDATPGLRICALAPGVVDTPMQGEIRASTLDRFPLRDRFAEMQASGGLIAPAECAMHLVDFLLDEDFGREPVADLRELMG